MSGVRIYLRGDEALKAVFRNAPNKLTGQLQSMAINTALDARDAAAAKAGTRTGRLARSIVGDVSVTDTSVSINLRSEGVPYAHIQEMGGATPPHIISSGNALAFFWASLSSVRQGSTAFFAKVNHPGGIIPGKHFIREGLQSVREEFRSACREAMVNALQGS